MTTTMMMIRFIMTTMLMMMIRLIMMMKMMIRLIMTTIGVAALLLLLKWSKKWIEAHTEGGRERERERSVKHGHYYSRFRTLHT